MLGAALLLGRAGELVRAMAHVFSLGSRAPTYLWRAFLGRDLPATTKRGATTDLDALLRAPRARLAKLALAYLAGPWSASSRGMVGSRASLLVTGLLARAKLRPAMPEALGRYVAPLAARAELTPRAKIDLPAPPVLEITGSPRDAARAQAELVGHARDFETWIRDSLAQATRERSGMYLRALPETAIDVATLSYAAGATVAHVRAWLAWAVDTDIARCAGRFAEDTLVAGPRTHLLAAAAVILGRERTLATAWRARRGDAGFDAARAWMSDPRTTQIDVPPVRVHGPSCGPFAVWPTAFARRGAESTPPVMHELVGIASPERPRFAWPGARPRSALPDLARIAEALWTSIASGGEPVANAAACLVIARCMLGLGAPVAEVGAWLRRAVDFAARGEHLDADLIGAARLVGRAPELAPTIGSYGGAAEDAFAAVLRAYATGAAPPPLSPALRKRTFFSELAAAAIAAHRRDATAFRKAIGRMPWRSRVEWTGADRRQRPPDLSWFTMALAADLGGADVLPPSARPWVDREIVAAAMASAL